MAINIVESKNLLDLLPYEADTKIFDAKMKAKILSLAYFTVKEVIETIQDFYINDELWQFDPHVGENLCQIRACQLIDFYLKAKSNIFIKKIQVEKLTAFKQLLAEINVLLQQYLAYPNQTCTPITVKVFLDSLQINPIIHYSLHFLFLSHFLTKYRMFNIQEDTIIDYSKLIASLNISKNFARKIIHQYQKQLSYYSCKYVEYNLSLYKIITPEIASMLRHQDDDGRYTLPSYIVMAALLERLKSLRINILLVIRKDYSFHQNVTSMLYTYNPETASYMLDHYPSDKMLSSPCFTIHGISTQAVSKDTIKNINIDLETLDLDTIIMANMASHPQYSGKKLTVFKDNPFNAIAANGECIMTETAKNLEQQFLSLKSLANNYGLSAVNSNLLHIRHIFCDQLDRQLQLAGMEYFYNMYDKIHTLDSSSTLKQQHEGHILA
jgi:hypothetical protein